MRDVRNEFGVLSDTMGGLAHVGRNLTFALTAPLIGIGAGAIKAAAGFDASMRNINSIVHMSEQALQSLSAQTLEFGATARAGPQAVAEALYEVYSAGLSGQAAFDVMTASVKTAEAGLADLSNTTNAITATVMAFSSQQMTAAKASDVWTRMVAVGVGSLEDFLANAQKVLPPASALGVSFEEVGAAAAYVSQQGGGARKAMTGLGMLMSNLMVPNTALTETYKKLGVVTGIDLVKKFGSLEKALFAIKGASKSTDAFFRSFSKTGREAVLALTNNMDATHKAFELFSEDVKGATDAARGEQLKSFAAQWDLMRAAVETTAITLGQVLMPILLPVINFVKDAAMAFTKLDPAIQKVIVVVGLLAAGLGPLLWLVSSLVSPISIVIGLIAGFATTVATNLGDAGTKIGDFVNSVFGDTTDLKNAVTGFIDTLFGTEAQTEMQSSIDTFMGSFGTTSATAEISGGIKIKFNEGDTIWSIWQRDFQGKADWADFNTSVQNELDKMGILATQIPVGLELDFGGTPTVPQGWSGTSAFQDLGITPNAVTSTTPIANSFADRLNKAVQEFLPRIGEALGPIVESIKNWFLNTALPALSEEAGYLGAKIVIGIGEGIGQALGNLANWIGGGGAGEVTNAVKDKVADPFSKGVQRAVAESDLGNLNIGDAIATAIAGALGTLAVGTVLFGGIGTAFSLGITVVTAATGWIVSIATSIIGALASAIGLSSLGATLVGGIGTLLTSSLGLITAAAGWVVSGATAIIGALAAAIAAAPLLLVGLVIGLAAGAIVALDPGLQQAINDAVAGFKWVVGGEEAGGPLTVDVGNKEIVAENTADLQKRLNDQLALDFANGQPIDMSEYGINVDYESLIANNQAMDFSDSLGARFGTTVAAAITTASQAPELTAATDALTQGVAAEIVTSFGEGTPVRLAWDGFVTAVTTGSSTVSTQVRALLGTMSIVVPIIGGLIIGMKNVWVSQMDLMRYHTIMLRGVVSNLAGAISDLAGAIGMLMGLKIDYTPPAAGGGGGMPGRASGGSLKGWGMTGELGPEPVYFGNKGMVMPHRWMREMGSDAGGGGNTIYINGVQDVDAILFELRRRGVEL